MPACMYCIWLDDKAHAFSNAHLFCVCVCVPLSEQYKHAHIAYTIVTNRKMKNLFVTLQCNFDCNCLAANWIDVTVMFVEHLSNDRSLHLYVYELFECSVDYSSFFHYFFFLSRQNSTFLIYKMLCK